MFNLLVVYNVGLEKLFTAFSSVAVSHQTPSEVILTLLSGHKELLIICASDLILLCNENFLSFSENG